MHQLQILLGFDEPEFEKGLRACFENMGYNVHIIVKFTKLSIREYLHNNPDCQAAVLLEVSTNGTMYTAEELAQLTDERDLNIVAVVGGRHKGTAFMETLYGAGITSAILQEGIRGAKVKDVCELILHKRPRKDARVYYGLADKHIDLGFLNNQDYVEFYNYFKENEAELTCVERFIRLCDRLSPPQLADFIRRLPENELSELVQYEEFHVVLGLLRKEGIRFNVKRPKKLLIGLKKPGTFGIEQNTITYVQMDAQASTGVLNENKAGKEEGAASNVAPTMQASQEAPLTMNSLLALVGGTSLQESEPMEESTPTKAETPIDTCIDSSQAENVKSDMYDNAAQSLVDDFLSESSVSEKIEKDINTPLFETSSSINTSSMASQVESTKTSNMSAAMHKLQRRRRIRLLLSIAAGVGLTLIVGSIAFMFATGILSLPF